MPETYGIHDDFGGVQDRDDDEGVVVPTSLLHLYLFEGWCHLEDVFNKPNTCDGI